jgi:hypothetical protein
MECIGSAEGGEFALTATVYSPRSACTGNKEMDDFHRRGKAALALRGGPGPKIDQEVQIREDFAN